MRKEDSEGKGERVIGGRWGKEKDTFYACINKRDITSKVASYRGPRQLR